MMIKAPEAATRFLTFVNASPTPFHAVAVAGLKLETAGFIKVRVNSRATSIQSLTRFQIKEKDEWEKNIKPGGKYYFTR